MESWNALPRLVISRECNLLINLIATLEFRVVDFSNSAHDRCRPAKSWRTQKREATRIMTRISAIAALGFIFQIFCSPAYAVSCTQQGATCAAWATGPNASYKAACKTEIGACIARCKQGQKVFIGVAVGNSYPIDTCK